MPLLRSLQGGGQLRFHPEVVLRQSLHCRSHPKTHQQLTKTPNRVLYTYGSDRRHCTSVARPPITLFSSSILPRPLHLSAMSSSTQSRSHSGHSHHHDNSYLTSTNKKDAGARITRIGLYVNIGMAISKGIGGYYLHSQALVADAFHALTDMVSDVMTLVTVEKANKLPTTQYPNGYGKVESLGSLAVSGLLALGGVLMLNNCGGLLYAQFFADAATAATHGHGFLNFLGLSHSHTHTIPNLNAAWLAAGSIVIKEYLYRASMVYLTHSEATTNFPSLSHEDC